VDQIFDVKRQRSDPTVTDVRRENVGVNDLTCKTKKQYMVGGGGGGGGGGCGGGGGGLDGFYALKKENGGQEGHFGMRKRLHNGWRFSKRVTSATCKGS